MIKFQNMTPEIYYDRSRDFQFIGRLYDVVLNYVKTNVDLVTNLYSNSLDNAKIIELLTLTLGFKAKHDYSTKQLQAICSVLPYILKHKGSLEAITLACNTILTAEAITAKIQIEVTSTNVIIYVPTNAIDLNLLYDLLDYILPAGMCCSIIISTPGEDIDYTLKNSFSTVATWVSPAITDAEDISYIPTGSDTTQAGIIDKAIVLAK